MPQGSPSGIDQQGSYENDRNVVGDRAAADLAAEKVSTTAAITNRARHAEEAR